MQSESFTTSPIDVTSLLEAGIAAARAGDRKQARKLLKKVVRLAPHHIQAWVWLSSVVDDLEQQETCLEKILAIDPQHRVARKGLKALQKKKAARQATPPLKKLSKRPLPQQNDEPAPDESTSAGGSRYKRLDPAVTIQAHPDSESALPPPAAVVTEKPSANGSQASSDKIAPAKEIAPLPKKIKRGPVKDIFTSEYLCPYCAQPTQHEEKTCPSCDGNLWEETLRRRDTSKLYRFLLWSHIISNIIYISLALTLIRAALDSQFITGGQAAGILCFFAPSVAYFVVVLVILHRRMKLFFKVYLIQAILFFGLSTSVAAGLSFTAVPLLIKFFSVGLAILSIGQFFMALNLGEDFTYDRKRILLMPEAEENTGVAFMKRGRFYARQKMWAMAALHFRQAAFKLTKNVEPRLSLALTYINLDKYEHALDSLDIARQINPTDQRIDKLEAQITERLAENPKTHAQL